MFLPEMMYRKSNLPECVNVITGNDAPEVKPTWLYECFCRKRCPRLPPCRRYFRWSASVHSVSGSCSWWLSCVLRNDIFMFYNKKDRLFCELNIDTGRKHRDASSQLTGGYDEVMITNDYLLTMDNGQCTMDSGQWTVAIFSDDKWVTKWRIVRQPL